MSATKKTEKSTILHFIPFTTSAILCLSYSVAFLFRCVRQERISLYKRVCPSVHPSICPSISVCYASLKFAVFGTFQLRRLIRIKSNTLWEALRLIHLSVCPSNCPSMYLICQAPKSIHTVTEPRSGRIVAWTGFLVACTRLYNPLCPSVGPSVCPSVGNTLLFWCLRAFFILLLLPKCLVSLFYHCPCPPARNFGSRVSGLVLQRSYHSTSGNIGQNWKKWSFLWFLTNHYFFFVSKWSLRIRFL